MSFRAIGLLVSFALVSISALAANVTTNHNDNFRTGWNPQETILTAANVNSTTFSLTAIVPLTAQVDAQPLVLSNQNVNGTVYATVVYVATEDNTVYAIDGTAGTVILSKSYEPPVSSTSLPSSSAFPNGCNNNSIFVGINSTPVIDTSTNTLYVVTSTLGSGTITHYLHALNTSTLNDNVTALPISAPPGVTYSRQRSALTLFNGAVLIPFTSFCDLNTTTSLGYIAYASAFGTQQQTLFQTSVYTLSTVWMSGSGPAVSGNNVYVMTGNQAVANGVSGPPASNIPDSFIELQGTAPPALGLSLVTWNTPDESLLVGNPPPDHDFGAGGVLIVPAGAPNSISASTAPQFLLGAGKEGVLFQTSPSLSGLISEATGGGCWCAQSYFTGADGLGHVVTGLGTTLDLYSVSPSEFLLTSSAALPAKGSGDPGLFSSISSNGTTAGSGVIWSIGGPDSSGSLTLNAFNASNLGSLFSVQGGYWPTSTANANVVPTVANGHVYVASYRDLHIFSAAAGALPATPTNLTLNGIADCPDIEVSYSAVSGATSYMVWQQTGNPSSIWIPANRILRYNGSSTTPVISTSNGNGPELVEVAACNQFGCSNPSAPKETGVPASCRNN